MELTFEQKLQQLQEIVSKLENDQLGLDDSVKLYEQAKLLSKELNDELNASIKKMAFIIEDGEVKTFEEDKSHKKDI